MTAFVNSLDKLHRTKRGKLIFGAIEFILAYIFATLAIDSGSIWQYFLAVILLIGGVNNLINAGKKNKQR